MRAVVDWPTPTCVKDVCSFLGMVGYFRRFVRDFFWTIMESDRLTLPSGLLLISSKLGYILTGKCTSHQPTKEVGTLFVHTQVMQSLTTSEPTFSSPPDSSLAPGPARRLESPDSFDRFSFSLRLSDFFPSLIFGLTFCCWECHVHTCT